MTTFGTLSAREVRDEIAAGRTTSVEATQFSLNAISNLNGPLHAFNSVFKDRAMEKAGGTRKLWKSRKRYLLEQ